MNVAARKARAIAIPAFVRDEVFFRLDGTSFPVEYRAEPIVRDGEPATY